MSIKAAFWPMGGQLKDPYEPGQVIFELSNGQNADIDAALEEGVFKLELVGGGSQNNGAYIASGGVIFYGAGGGGAAFVGEIFLTKGNYKYGSGPVVADTAAVGTAGSSSWFVTPERVGFEAQGGRGGSYMQQSGNEGGEIYVNEAWIVSQSIRSKGNVGGGAMTGSDGGASLYMGYGKGADNKWNGGTYATAGFIRLTYLRRNP